MNDDIDISDLFYNISQSKFVLTNRNKFRLIIMSKNDENTIKKLYMIEKNTFYIAKDLNYSGFLKRINKAYLILILYDKKDKRIISYLIASKIDKNAISIDSLVVIQPFRRLGIGKSMIETLKFLLKKEGKVNYIFVITLYEKRLINFYSSLKFKILKNDSYKKYKVLCIKLLNFLKNQFKEENIKAKINLQNIQEGILRDMFGEGYHGVIFICEI